MCLSRCTSSVLIASSFRSPNVGNQVNPKDHFLALQSRSVSGDWPARGHPEIATTNSSSVGTSFVGFERGSVSRQQLPLSCPRPNVAPLIIESTGALLRARASESVREMRP